MATWVAIGYPDETTASAAADEAEMLACELIIQPDAIAVVQSVVLSYLNELQVGLVCDPAAVTEPELLHECIEEGFTEVRKLAVASR